VKRDDRKVETVTAGTKRAWTWRLASLLLFAAFVVLVQHWVGWGQLMKPWRVVPLWTLAPALALVAASIVMRALRVHDHFRDRTRGAFGTTLRITLQHNLLNNLLPARAGELSFPLLMARRFGIPLQRTLPALLWFRLLDVLVLGGGAALVAGGFWVGPGVSIPLGIALLAAPWVLFRAQAALRRRLPQRGRAARLVHRVLEGLPAGERDFWVAWGWTGANWLAKLAAFAWVLRLFVDTPARVAALATVLGDATSVLPVHGLAGAGTYEAGVVAGLATGGVPPAAGLGAAVNLHLFLIGTTLLGGAASLGLGRGRRAVSAASPLVDASPVEGAA
jgi:uncharacterized membrane protein YbhN (UPF0104 family)